MKHGRWTILAIAAIAALGAGVAGCGGDDGGSGGGDVAALPASSCPAAFLYENLQIQNNLIHGSDSQESATKESALWFKKEEMVSYPTTDASWVG